MALRTATVGVVGAGQSARLIYQAGIALGIQVRLRAGHAEDAVALVTADVSRRPTRFKPAPAVCSADWGVLTFDHEFVFSVALGRPEDSTHGLRPGGAAVRLAQDKRR